MNIEIKKYPIEDSIGFSSRRGVRVLSNMDCSCPLYYEGVEYNSVEQLFHVLIYRRVAELAMKCKNGKEVKRLNALYMEDRDYRWDSVEEKKKKRQQLYQDMYDLLHICHQVKFKYNAEFQKVILESGDKYLVEDCHWLDGTKIRGELYGTRRDEKNGVFVGRNINGQSLMELRDEVRGVVSATSHSKEKAFPKATKTNEKPKELSDYLSDRMKMKVWDKWGKTVNLSVQRVECSIYEKLGFSRYHYIQCPINKASMCLLVRTSKGKPLGFIGFLNHTFKNCPNGLMVSRFVILPQYQRRGLALPILTRICGMLKAEGYRVFINTENHHLGKALTRSYSFRGTTFDQKERYIQYDAKYRHRRGGFAYRKEYCGSNVYGYGRMLKEVNVMRENKGKVVEISGKANDNKEVKPIYHPMIRHSHAVVVSMSGVDGLFGNKDKVGNNNEYWANGVVPQCSVRGTPLKLIGINELV